MGYLKKREELISEAEQSLEVLVKRFGVKSIYSSTKVLKIDKFFKNYTTFNIDVSEISSDKLIDTDGYLYSFKVLTDQEFFHIVDYLMVKYK